MLSRVVVGYHNRPRFWPNRVWCVDYSDCLGQVPPQSLAVQSSGPFEFISVWPERRMRLGKWIVDFVEWEIEGQSMIWTIVKWIVHIRDTASRREESELMEKISGQWTAAFRNVQSINSALIQRRRQRVQWMVVVLHCNSISSSTDWTQWPTSINYFSLIFIQIGFSVAMSLVVHLNGSSFLYYLHIVVRFLIDRTPPRSLLPAGVIAQSLGALKSIERKVVGEMTLHLVKSL